MRKPKGKWRRGLRRGEGETKGADRVGRGRQKRRKGV